MDKEEDFLTKDAIPEKDLKEMYKDKLDNIREEYAQIRLDIESRLH